ncbi:MAG TPA: hypothetical protein VFP77_07350 [Gemmatimonadaceae bacterium]|nr:hypothetical protein [Gemmatimonadaceae bacterium]
MTRIAAALLALAAELQVWLGGITTHHRFVLATVAVTTSSS